MERRANPIKKIVSAIFSYNSDHLLDRMDAYEQKLDVKNKTIAITTTSSIRVSFPNFKIFIKLSITKHNPNRFEDVGKICFEIFFLLFIASGIHNPPISSIINKHNTSKL
jgi:hypothetical protein